MPVIDNIPVISETELNNNKKSKNIYDNIIDKLERKYYLQSNLLSDNEDEVSNEGNDNIEISEDDEFFKHFNKTENFNNTRVYRNDSKNGQFLFKSAN